MEERRASPVEERLKVSSISLLLAPMFIGLVVDCRLDVESRLSDADDGRMASSEENPPRKASPRRLNPGRRQCFMHVLDGTDWQIRIQITIAHAPL
jgi:hypothetical protein